MNHSEPITTMRNVVFSTAAALLIALSLSLLSGCSSDDDQSESNTQNQPENTQEATQESDEPSEESGSPDALEASDDESESNEETEADNEDSEDELLEKAYSVDDLPSVKDAEEKTGVLADDAGTAYVEKEILVTIPNGADLEKVNKQLKFCEFIKEKSLTQDMLITGEIVEDEVVKGPSGQAIAIVHTAKNVTVPQALLGLKESSMLKDSEPNYIMEELQ